MGTPVAVTGAKLKRPAADKRAGISIKETGEQVQQKDGARRR